jgi:FkbM family methyltransferase
MRSAIRPSKLYIPEETRAYREKAVKIAGRPLATVFGALFRGCHYVAALNMFRVYEKPFEMYGRYLWGRGRYPAVVTVRTPSGILPLDVYSADDVLTVNEIFCRRDYPTESSDSVFVDFGSNIGISAAYFLSRGPASFAYLFEPLPSNLERLERNLHQFEGRYVLQGAAVGTRAGDAVFGWEQTGRYGGLGRKTGNYISVKCLDSNEVLREIIEKHGRIDVVKIDIETLERDVTERIPIELARKIHKVYVEYPFTRNPLAHTHTSRQYSNVTQFFNKESAARTWSGSGLSAVQGG